ncbi:MAG: hypothetical protein JNJ46_23335 [Myxococcales bacterium]|jgi:hypothetical protein|nr:hypothetical protein [Myxococcales bacterium]
MREQTLDMYHQEARVLLSRFLDPALAATRMDMAQALRPEPNDYARVFLPTVAEAARTGYSVLWENLPPWPVRDDQVRLEIAVARSEDFVERNERAQHFPGGYLSIASQLQPGQIWVCWEFIAPSREAGVAMDGLVSLGTRWAWFPKPWKVLPSAPPLLPMRHFSE